MERESWIFSLLVLFTISLSSFKKVLVEIIINGSNLICHVIRLDLLDRGAVSYCLLHNKYKDEYESKQFKVLEDKLSTDFKTAHDKVKDVVAKWNESSHEKRFGLLQEYFEAIVVSKINFSKE